MGIGIQQRLERGAELVGYSAEHIMEAGWQPLDLERVLFWALVTKCQHRLQTVCPACSTISADTQALHIAHAHE